MSYLARAEAEAKFPIELTSGRDYKAWAKRIMYREDRRDSSLLPIQVEFAKQALNIDQEPTNAR